MTNPKAAAWYGVSGVEELALAGGLGQNVARQAFTFDGGAGSGAVGQIDLFTVTGAVLVRLTAICTADLTDAAAGATISVGTAGEVDGIIAVTSAVTIDAGEIWFAAAPATVLNTEANAFLNYVIGDGADITADVLVEAVTGGTIVFTAFWTPLTAGASVAAA